MAKSARKLITRRLPVDLWERVQAYAASLDPRVSDTALIESALKEYLDKHEKSPKARSRKSI